MAVCNTRSRLQGCLKRCFRAALRNHFGGLLATSTLAAALLCNTATAQQPQRLSQWEMTNTPVSIDTMNDSQIVRLVINTSREITANRNFSDVRIHNPNILSALPLKGNKLQISAKTTGITQIDLIGADGDTHTIEVMVLGDVRELEANLRTAFPSASLQVTPVNQGCIISGFVTRDEDVEQVNSIAALYFPTVIDQIEVSGVFTIQLETQIMEVSRTKLRSLGIDWAFANGDDAITQSVSGLLSATGTAFSPTGTETLTIGVIENGSSFFTAIQALRQHGLVKTLASPTLTAIDGRPASFNAGGEIPIVIPAGLGQVAVQYREFGTRLDYVAKVRGNGKILLEVRPYVSEIDPSRSVSIQGISVPGLRSRFLETGVEIGAGQTLALGGLLQVKSETINLGLPVLADMPYFGTFFRSTREEQNEIELLITVTPNFAGPMEPHEVPRIAPGMSSQPPTDKELYLRGYMETPLNEMGCGPNGVPMGMIGGGEMGYGGMPVGAPVNVPAPGPAPGYTPAPGFAPTPQPSLPVPNPAAMSVGPNAPKLAKQPQAYSPYSTQPDSPQPAVIR